MIFKIKKVTSRQITTLKEADKFFTQFQDIKNPVIDNTLMSKLAVELWIDWRNERKLLATYLNYRLAWKNEWKAQWEKTRTKRWTFEIASTMRTFMGNKKQSNLSPKKGSWITRI